MDYTCVRYVHWKLKFSCTGVSTSFIALQRIPADPYDFGPLFQTRKQWAHTHPGESGKPRSLPAGPQLVMAC